MASGNIDELLSVFREYELSLSYIPSDEVLQYFTLISNVP